MLSGTCVSLRFCVGCNGDSWLPAHDEVRCSVQRVIGVTGGGTLDFLESLVVSLTVSADVLDGGCGIIPDSGFSCVYRQKSVGCCSIT